MVEQGFRVVIGAAANNGFGLVRDSRGLELRPKYLEPPTISIHLSASL